MRSRMIADDFELNLMSWLLSADLSKTDRKSKKLFI